MTVSSSVEVRKRFNCTGGTIYNLPAAFKFFEATDLIVYRIDALGNESVLDLVTDYSVSGGSGGSGSVTTVNTFSDGELLVIAEVPVEQGYDMIFGDGFLPDEMEKQLDRQTLNIRRVREIMGRAITWPETTEGLDGNLPSPVAGFGLRINDTADGMALFPLPFGSLVQSRQVFVATPGQDLFTLTGGLEYSTGTNNIAVYLDGVRLYPAEYDETSTSSFTLTTPAAGGEEVMVVVNSVDTSVGLIGSVAPEVGKAALWDGLRKFDVRIYGLGLSTTNGTDDWTTAFNNCATACAAAGGVMIGGDGDLYSIESVRIPNGVRAFLFANSVIISRGVAMGTPTGGGVLGVVQLDGTLYGSGVRTQKCLVSCEIDVSAGDRMAIYTDDAADNDIVGCKIYGFTNHASLNHYGIALGQGAGGNRVYFNKVWGYDTPTQRGLLIDLIGEEGGANGFGGYFDGDGVIDDPITPCENNVIVGNQLYKGSYGINLLSSNHNVVVGNLCDGQNHRGIYVAGAAHKNTIVGNQIREFYSSGILLGYNAHDNDVHGNTLVKTTNPGNGQAGININTGASNNNVTGNQIDAPVNYGIYLGWDMVGNFVHGNKIRNHYLAAIGLENDFINPRPAGAIYSSPDSYVAPTVGTYWSYRDTEKNVITNNVIGVPYAGRTVCPISVAQIGTRTKVKGNIIANNVVLEATQVSYFMHVYEDNGGDLFDNILKNNVFSGATLAKFYFNRAGVPSTSDGGSFFREWGGNGILDDALNSAPITLPASDATPDITSGWKNRFYFKLNNGALFHITDFDFDSTLIAEGTEIMLRGDGQTVIDYGSGTIRTKDLVNTPQITSNQFIKFKLLSNIWYEIWRSF